MRRADKWIADDGTVFEGEKAYAECREYEGKLREQVYEPLRGMIRFFDWEGQPLPYHLVAEGTTVHYAEVLRIPEDDDDYKHLWDVLLPAELNEQLWYETDCGIWVFEDEQYWRSWESIIKDFDEIKRCVDKIKGEG